ncbi:hypothetical protein jhhlp_007171 [Lomentospora prolificans]|uniref:AMP-dependent synthetase/ligase domain-containing protein n=1 Tax=Lomentospora prolificans TaxID=41688 RepID=A0A2N3N1X6_9PEZI|nr:hypothetical protein jhhlp_007171 [Lomentospora prolificans]
MVVDEPLQRATRKLTSTMPLTSPYPEVPLPRSDLWSFLFERDDLAFGPDHVLLVDGETQRSYNFGQIKTLSAEFGKGLKSQWNWQKGDVLALYTPNSIDTPIVMLGTLWAGGIICPANPLYTAGELTHQLKDAKASAIATQLPMLPIAREAAANAGIPENRIILIGDNHDEAGKFKHWTQITNQNRIFTPKKTKVDPMKDLAFIVYSSVSIPAGTTGLPKGVVLTHFNVVANMAQIKNFDFKYLNWDKDVQLGVLPFFHIYGLAIIILGGMNAGIRTVVMPKFDLERFCQLVQEHQVSVTYVPPPIVLALAKHPLVSKYDLSSIRFLNCAAAPLTRELVEELWQRLKLPVKQGYGLSETSPAAVLQMLDEFGKFVGSIGKLIPNMTAKIVDADGNEITKAGEAGELLLKGPNVFSGYLNKPEQNKEVFTEDGYFKTGDIVYRDEKGNFYVTDRVKELIKFNGFQVAPAELEGMLLGREDIIDTCVIGVWDNERQTEVPRAYVVIKPGLTKDNALAQDIVEWLAKQTAPHKRLRGGVRFVDVIPKSQAGKLLRRVLKDQAKQEEDAAKDKAKL